MPRFFSDNIQDNYIQITGEDALHITRSLRMKNGEILEVCDLKGNDYICKIESSDQTLVVATIISSSKSVSEPNHKITLYQALPKSDKFDVIIQKSVELGVNMIVPFISNRCISRPDEKSFTKKLERFNKLSLEASKQSGRGIIPKVMPLLTFRQAILEMKDYSLPLFFYESGGVSLSTILNDSTPLDIAIMIGSEGGFDQSEADLAAINGIYTTTLGKRILRCETAPICALSAIFYATKELE